MRSFVLCQVARVSKTNVVASARIGQGVRSIHLFGMEKQQKHRFSCSCTYCTTTVLGANKTNDTPPGSGIVSATGANLQELLQIEKERNLKLQEENERLRRDISLNYENPDLAKQDPDIAKLLENNKNWVKTQSVSTR
jgi:hypothetical protein